MGGSTLQTALESVLHSHSREGCTLLPAEFQKAKGEPDLGVSEHQQKHDGNQKELTLSHLSLKLKDFAD